MYDGMSYCKCGNVTSYVQIESGSMLSFDEYKVFLEAKGAKIIDELCEECAVYAMKVGSEVEMDKLGARDVG